MRDKKGVLVKQVRVEEDLVGMVDEVDRRGVWVWVGVRARHGRQSR